MSENFLVISIVVITAAIMIFFSYKKLKRKDYCSMCKKNKNRKYR